MKSRVAFIQPIITPPETKMVSRYDPFSMWGCPQCHNKSLVGILNEEMTIETGFFCGPCNIQYKFIEKEDVPVSPFGLNFGVR